MSNSNWIEEKDGWHKSPKSSTRGSADYFSKPIPPVRDNAGRPLIPNSGGKVDWQRLCQEKEGNGGS